MNGIRVRTPHGEGILTGVTTQVEGGPRLHEVWVAGERFEREGGVLELEDTPPPWRVAVMRALSSGQGGRIDARRDDVVWALRTLGRAHCTLPPYAVEARSWGGSWVRFEVRR